MCRLPRRPHDALSPLDTVDMQKAIRPRHWAREGSFSPSSEVPWRGCHIPCSPVSYSPTLHCLQGLSELPCEGICVLVPPCRETRQNTEDHSLRGSRDHRRHLFSFSFPQSHGFNTKTFPTTTRSLRLEGREDALPHIQITTFVKSDHLSMIFTDESDDRPGSPYYYLVVIIRSSHKVLGPPWTSAEI